MEVYQLKHQMKIVNERLGNMSCNLKTLTKELQSRKAESSEMKEKETKVG